MSLNSFILEGNRFGAVNRVDLRAFIHTIKTRMIREKDPIKKIMWAEIGTELNNLLLRME